MKQQADELESIRLKEEIPFNVKMAKDIASIAGWVKFFGILTIPGIVASVIYGIGVSAYWW